jgi:hypothetical protein
MSNNDVESLNITGNVPWVLSFPYFATVDQAFDSLFQKQYSPYGVIFNDAELITAEAFEHCSNLAVLGLRDTITFGENALAKLAPSTLEITVSHPEIFASYLSDLNVAGLRFSAILKVYIKLSDSAAQSASISTYVANLLAGLPPPRKSPEFRAF